MEKEKTIDTLNNLIQINNDRIEGYKTAADETKESDLKSLFSQFQATSAKINGELRSEVSRLGGTPTESTRITGKFFRVWMDVKAALTGNDRKSILESCEYGEDVAKKTYEDVLANDSENLSSEQQSMLKEQHSSLVSDYNKVKSMNDAHVSI
ncbi:PA2169 family four-helix-bundle protein [Flavobacterium sp.]|uniref:ferritin-like domain-containing protein n=1 Tax=Flavobacterium sp. TaxID=239 RepID=UPI0025F51F1D|nr:PA2169 family four-helix-bundle protein [Flavobacterium sp.]